MPRFGISIYGVSRKIRTGEMTPISAFERICRMGAEVVELVPFGFNLVETPELKKDFKEASRRLGVPIGNYSLNANFLMLTPEEYGREMARVKQHIDMVSDMEIPTIRVDSAAYRRPMTENTMEKFERCREIAPLHTGPSIMGIQGCQAVMPDIPQAIVFDTVFHQTMPDYAYTYAIPYDVAEKYGIRRYGFHGTSHRYVSIEAAKMLGKPIEETKIITCHMGNGSSITAVKGGKCIDTSMGFTPLAGVEMGTRCGDIDPAVVTYIMKKEGYTPDEMDNYMNKKCGFLGLSGVSSDSRDVENAITEGNEHARISADVLGYQTKKYIGSYAAAMDGVDAIVFTAGMGENNPMLRERACKDLSYLGIEIDQEINYATIKKPEGVEISTPNSKVKVLVIPTNEELMIARETEALIKATK